MKEILSVSHYCVCDLLGQGPYKISTSLFGGVGHVRNCTTVFFMWGGRICKEILCGYPQCIWS
jgi:hypothetical protein